MKPTNFFKPSHLCAFAIFALNLSTLTTPSPAQETAELIPVPPPSNQPPPPPAKTLEITPDEIISTRTIVRPDQTITIQEIVPQDLELPPLPPPPKPPTPEQLAARAARLAQRGHFRSSALSCDIHHNEDGTVRSHIKWTSQGKIPVESYEAWSNINFHHLTQTGNFKKDNTTHSLMILCHDVRSQQARARDQRLNIPYTSPAIPALPNDSTAQPTFQITRGNPAPEDLAVLEGLHELYQKHHTDFIAQVEKINQINAQRAAELAANPPDPTPDIIIRYWIPEKTLAEKQQEQQLQEEASKPEGGAQ